MIVQTIDRVCRLLASRRELERMVDDAHKALRRAHQDLHDLSVDAAQMAGELAVLRKVMDCPGPAQHIRLAARAERAESLYEQRIAPDSVLTTLDMEEENDRD